MPEENIAEIAEVAMEAVVDEARAEGAGLHKWVQWASLSTMAMALCSAAGALLAGQTANEALINRQEEIHDLIDVTRSALEAEMLRTRVVVLEAVGEKSQQTLIDRIQDIDQSLPKQADQVYKDLEASDIALHSHELFAIATTILSVAITLTGMSVIVRRKNIWYLSLFIAFVGAALLVCAFITIAR